MKAARTFLISVGIAGLLYAFLTFAVGRMQGETATTKGGGVSVAVTELPPAVKAAIEKESQGGTVKKIEKHMDEGKAVYEADLVINGTQRTVTVAETGEIVPRGGDDDYD
jgi:hypothetical protein